MDVVNRIGVVRVNKAWARLVGLVMGVLALPSLALAHGGDDHGAALRTVEPGVEVHRVEVSSSRYELVLRWPHADAGEPLSFEAFISDFETNAPVDGAAVELRLVGVESPQAMLHAAGRGRYLGETVSPSAGRYAMTMVVTLSNGGDVFVADGLELGPHEDAHHEEPHEAELPWVFWAGLGGLVVVGLVLLGVAAGRARRRAGPALVFAIAGFLGAVETHGARAHGGDHREPGWSRRAPQRSAESVGAPDEEGRTADGDPAAHCDRNGHSPGWP
jgi:hypothetical protein